MAHQGVAHKEKRDGKNSQQAGACDKYALQDSFHHTSLGDTCSVCIKQPAHGSGAVPRYRVARKSAHSMIMLPVCDFLPVGGLLFLGFLLFGLGLPFFLHCFLGFFLIILFGVHGFSHNHPPVDFDIPYMVVTRHDLSASTGGILRTAQAKINKDSGGAGRSHESQMSPCAGKNLFDRQVSRIVARVYAVDLVLLLGENELERTGRWALQIV